MGLMILFHLVTKGIKILIALCGAYALLRGEVRFSSTRTLRGVPARIVGGLILVPGVLSLCCEELLWRWFGLDFVFALLVPIVIALIYAALKAETIRPASKES